MLNMYSRKNALMHARQIRTCPPLSMAQNADFADQVARHRDICPHCPAAPLEFVEKIVDVRPDRVPRTDIPVEAGQLRYLNARQARWRDDFFTIRLSCWCWTCITRWETAFASPRCMTTSCLPDPEI